MFWCVNDVGFFQQTTNHECRTTEVAESRLGHTWYFHVLIFQHVLLNVPRALRRLQQNVPPAMEDTTLMEQHALVIKHTTISDVLNLYMIFKKDRNY